MDHLHPAEGTGINAGRRAGHDAIRTLIAAGGGCEVPRPWTGSDCHGFTPGRPATTTLPCGPVHPGYDVHAITFGRRQEHRKEIASASRTGR